jgi:murein L,D-transpeptidase YafK
LKSILAFILLTFLLQKGEFKKNQLAQSRVKQAYTAQEQRMKEAYKKQDLVLGQTSIFIQIFKAENLLELWGTDGKHPYKKIKTYEICAASGQLGPKRKMGDRQVPEGFYEIDRFNPQSAFHLSLGINYPNASDKILSDARHPGGDIFIHGQCVSIGCVAITDPYIQELYVAAVEAKEAGQSRIPVYIFPFRMQETNVQKYTKRYPDKELTAFWTNLKEGYDYFEKNKKNPSIRVDTKGKYIIQ